MDKEFTVWNDDAGFPFVVQRKGIAYVHVNGGTVATGQNLSTMLDILNDCADHLSAMQALRAKLSQEEVLCNDTE